MSDEETQKAEDTSVEATEAAEETSDEAPAGEVEGAVGEAEAA